MDLSVIYSKTGKGMRTLKSKDLPSHLLRILALIDGKSKAEALLAQSGRVTEQEMSQALTRLENEGYIRPLLTRAVEETWAPNNTFSPMVVEEVYQVEEVEVDTLDFTDYTAAEAKKEAETKAKAEVERKAREEAEAKAKAEAERKAKEEAEARAKTETEARAKAEAERKVKEEAERKAHVEAEAKKEAKRKARVAAEAEAQAKEEAKRKAEDEARAKAEAERKVKEEAERKVKEEAERKAREEAEAKAAAERKAKEEAEARTKAEAEARAKAEAERKAHEEAEAKAKAEAERKAGEEAEVRARAEAERKAREEEARAKKEAEHKARVEAETKTKAETERKAREEAETRAKAEAERKAREEAEARAKAEAEARAKAEAERKAHEEAEARKETKRKAREAAEAEAQAKAEAKRKAKEEAEAAKASAEAERKAQKAAEAQAKAEARIKPETGHKAGEEAEAERKAREALEAQFNAEVERRAREEAEAKAKAEAERKAREETEGRLDAEIERKAREETEAQAEAERREREAVTAKARTEAERRAREEEAQAEARRRAHEQAEAEAAAQETELEREMRVSIEPRVEHRANPVAIGKLLRIAGISVSATVLLLLVLLHLVDLRWFIPMEKLVSGRIGEPVTIGSVHSTLLPSPHLLLEDVSIGKEKDIKIAEIRAVPMLATLLDNTKVFKSIDVESLAIPVENVERAAKWLDGGRDPGNLRLGRIYLKNAQVVVQGLELPSFNADIALDKSDHFESAELKSTDDKIKVKVNPRFDALQLEIAAMAWQPPIGAKFVFDELNAKATASRQGMQITEIDGRIYEGKLKGTASVNWQNQWSANGDFELSNANLASLTGFFNPDTALAGRLDLKGIYSAQSNSLPTLLDRPSIKADFSCIDGSIGGVDLVRLLLQGGGRVNSGEKTTNYTNLTGNMALTDGHYQFRQIKLAGKQLSASGEVDMTPNKVLSGNITADFAVKSRKLHGQLTLSGNLKQPQLQ